MPAYAKTIAETDDPAIQKHIEIMRAAGIEPSNFTVFGQLLAELMVEVLKNADDPPTRQGLLQAAENVRAWQSGLALTPVCMSPEDHRPWEALRFWRAEGGPGCLVGDGRPGQRR